MIATATVLEGTAAVLLARVLGIDGTPVTKADVAGGTLKVFDMDSAEQVGETLALDPDAVLFDTLQQDDRWGADSEGYNFAATLPSACLPDGNSTYQAEVTLTPAEGEALRLVYRLTTENLFGL